MARKRSTVVAAGALIWRVRNGELQVLAVHRPAYDDWSWPKGKPIRGESIAETAAREVYEETGKQVVLGQPLPKVKYLLASGRPKEVHYWTAHSTSTSHPALLARPRWKLAPKREIDNSKWITVEQAQTKITMKADLKPLEVLVDLYENDRLDTRAFILARHARARRRTAWVFDDIARPITGGGARRAHQLIQMFSAFGIRYVDSSPAARCLMTVQPYAAAIGKKVKTHDALTEGTHQSHPVDAAKTLAALLEKPGHRVLCVHRPTMPTLLEMMAAATRKWTRGKLPKANPYLPAGGVLVAHVLDTESGPRIAALETHLLT